MHEALRVRGAERFRHGHHDGERHFEGQAPPRTVDVGAQILALEQLLHDEGEAALVLVDVEDLDHVRVAHEVGHLRLAQEARAHVLALRQAGQEDLDGHLAPHEGVGRAIHLAHAAHGDARIQLVLAPDALSAAIRRRWSWHQHRGRVSAKTCPIWKQKRKTGATRRRALDDALSEFDIKG